MLQELELRRPWASRRSSSASSWPSHAVGGLSDRAAIERQARGSRRDRSAPGRSSWRPSKGRRPRRSSSRFAELARTDPSPVVRLYLASALQRLPLENRWEILAGLVGHAEDAADHNLPLMYWYAAEPLAAARRVAGRPAGVGVADPADPGVHGAADRGARDAGVDGAPGRRAGPRRRSGRALDALDRDRGSAARPAAGGDAGRLARGLRRSWPPTPTRSVRSRAWPWALTFGDPAARASLRRVLADAKADLGLAARGARGACSR